MITGAHVLLYSTDPEADRVFLRDALDLPSIDIGGGWMIFGLPPAELAVHPGDGSFEQRHAGHSMIGALVYLMCDDLHATVAELERRQVACGEVAEERWGIRTTFRLPSGAEMGVYQPSHPTALKLWMAR